MTDDLADEMFLQAVSLIKEGRIVEARSKLQNLLSRFPEYGRGHNHLGWIYETSFQDYAAAENHYKQALQYAPEYPAAYQNYAVCLSTLKKFDELEQLLEKALTVPGLDRSAVYNEYAIMYEVQGNYELAIKYYGEYIKHVFGHDLIDSAMGSIERCKRKRDIFENI